MALTKIKSTVRVVLNQAARMAGGILLSARSYQSLLSSRRLAVEGLAAHEGRALTPGLTVVVFSFNRAMQLHATLSTYFEMCAHPAPVIVQYAASTPAHAKAYAEVEKLFAKAPAKVTFVKESKFAQTLPQVLEMIPTRNMFFLTDDDVFIRPVDLSLAHKIDATRYLYSLRLGPHLRRSYTMAMAQTPPMFRPSSLGPDLLEFTLGEQGNEWSYPYSVEGHVFPTAEIRVLSRLTSYKAPNTYEGALHECADIAMARIGVCHTHSKLLNIPINMVQSEVNNRAGSISPEWLLEQWNAGMMFSSAHLANHTPHSPHEEHPVRLLPRKKPAAAKKSKSAAKKAKGRR
ncbi:MAG: hypothetical protein GC129_03900 [Proteobacteria bacterium]|nr:hypothetical protein [Pseudomonadota bacterium]